MPKLSAADKSNDKALKLRFSHRVKSSIFEKPQRHRHIKILQKQFDIIIEHSRIPERRIEIDLYEDLVGYRGPSIPSTLASSVATLRFFDVPSSGWPVAGFIGDEDTRVLLRETIARTPRASRRDDFVIFILGIYLTLHGKHLWLCQDIQDRDES